MFKGQFYGASKYHARKTEYGGVIYDSKKESLFAWQLDMKKRAGAIRDWSRQYPFKLFAYGQLITTYRIDFRVVHNDGSIEYVEVKGFTGESAWRLRWKMLKAYIEQNEPEAVLTLEL